MSKELSMVESRLIKITYDFLTELKSKKIEKELSLKDSLEHDLGLGSLEQAELFRRIENEFAVQIPDVQLAKIISLQDFISALQQVVPIVQKEKKKFYFPFGPSRIDPNSTETLIDLLFQYGQLEPERPHIYLPDDYGNEQIITYGELLKKGSDIAQALIEQSLQPGETVAIMLPTSREFFWSFFGILLAGGVPVPIYPPTQANRIEEYIRREAKILSNAQIRYLITFSAARRLSQWLKSFLPELRMVCTVEELLEKSSPFYQKIILATDVALIQYTSGSTGDPKGVVLTHQNILANIRAVGLALQINSRDVIVSWLPLYHDMGLIGAWLGSLYHGIPIIIFSPLMFLTRAERWLWAMDYYRGTISAGPNFAYELCVNKIDESKISGLDLSSWRLALNGAETIHANTIKKFTDKFASYQFNPQAFLPVYGLAESTVALVFPELNRIPRIDYIERKVFNEQGKAKSISPSLSQATGLAMVSCGRPLPGHEVRIVDDTHQLLEDRQVGHLQFKGPSSMRGYYRNAIATRAIYHEGWWDSGDLAYQAEGDIFIAGRKKDLIIIAGRNIYPQEIEAIADNLVSIRKGCVIAFGITDVEKGTEQCVVVAEVRQKKWIVDKEISHQIVTAVAEALDISPQVILVPPRTLPKTSSGKLQRSACKKAYLQGCLTRRTWPVWVQMGKIFFSGLGNKILRGIVNLGKRIFMIYAGICLILTVPPLWLLVLPCSHNRTLWWVRQWTKLILKLINCHVKVNGYRPDLQDQVHILVANHASYVDAIILLAALPIDFAFVVKKELLKVPLLSTFIKKLAYIPVNRFDFLESLQDEKLIETALLQQRSLLIFPEGTFTDKVGLRPFKMGAFKLSVETNIPVCPISLNGTRRMLPDNKWLLTPTTVMVTVGEIITPEGQGWQEMAKLRDLAGVQISCYCGEPFE